MDTKPVDPIAIRVPVFADMIGVSRSKGYAVVKAHPELLIDIDGTKRVSVERARQMFTAKKQDAERMRRRS